MPMLLISSNYLNSKLVHQAPQQFVADYTAFCYETNVLQYDKRGTNYYVREVLWIVAYIENTYGAFFLLIPQERLKTLREFHKY